jgi:peptidoglycan/LPS O-acetylase OafA/YrhL
VSTQIDMLEGARPSSVAAVSLPDEVCPAPGRAHLARPVYKPQLDALRFLAFFSVFILHALPSGPKHLPGSFAHAYQGLIGFRDATGFGLCIFFCLSSYLITELLLFEKLTNRSVDLGHFYIRRVLRIWPLYFGFIAICLLIFGPSQQAGTEWPRIVALILLAGNWYVGRYGFGDGPLVPLWSISLEEQFYVLWPHLVKRLAVRWLLLLSLLICLSSLVAVFLLRSHKVNLESGLWTNSLVQFQFFAAGTALAITLRDREISSKWAPVLLAAGACAFVFAAAVCKIKNDAAAPSAFVVCVGYALVLGGTAATLAGALAFPATLIPKPLVFLGKISYGLYVFHELCLYVASMHFAKGPVALLLARLCAFAATVALATVSYFVFERPFLRLKDRFSHVITRPV